MKKIIILVATLSLLTGCIKQTKDSSVQIADDYGRDILPGEANYYYTFTGESEHLQFQDGMADYRDDNAIFWIKQLKSKTSSSFSANIFIYFNDKLSSYTYVNNKNLQEDNFIASEYGKKIKRDEDGNMYGEISLFMKTLPEDFPNAIRVEANYCEENENCQMETFKLDVKKGE